MQRWLFLALITVMSIGTMGVSAQEPSQEVFFGLREDGTFISYTLDGTQTELLTGVSRQGVRLLKTDLPEQSLLVAEVNGRIGLYGVGSTQSPQPIALPDPFSVEDTNWTIFARHHPFYVLQALTQYPESIGLVVNVDTLEAQLLTGSLLFLNQQIVQFSADGTKLRYPSKVSDNQLTWNLIERDLASSEEHTFYSVDEYYPAFSSDSEGGRWLLRRVERGTKIATDYLIQPDGTITEIAQDDAGAYHLRVIWNDQLYVSPARCETGCEIKISPLSEGDKASMTFTAPALETLPTPLTMPDANHLLIIDSGTYWLLNTDGSSQKLGITDPVVMIQPNTLSNDERWLMTLTTDDDDAQTGYKVWDLSSGQTVLDSNEPHQLLNRFYDDEGIIVWEYQNTHQIYRLNDRQTFTLDIGRHETVFAFANPTVVLVNVAKDSDIGAPGIYAYDLEAATYTLVAADARPLVAF